MLRNGGKMYEPYSLFCNMKRVLYLVRWRLFSSCIYPCATPPGSVFVGCPSAISKPYFYFPPVVCYQFQSTTIMPSSSSGSSTNADNSGIAESRSPADRPAPVSPIQIGTSSRNDLHPCLLASLRVTLLHVVLKGLPWRREIPLGRRMLVTSP